MGGFFSACDCVASGAKPTSKRGYQHKGNALKGLGRAAEAEQAYQRARRLH